MMKMSTWLLVAVVVAVVAVAPRFATAAQQGDMYLLVRQWSPTFCEDKSCVKGQDPEMMTIHGLWYVCSPSPSPSPSPPPSPARRTLTPPSSPLARPTGLTYEDGSPAYCTKEKFSTSALTDATIDRMNCAWPSATGTNEGFWAHEWEKHGTCAGFSSQEGYFNATLNANDRYDLNVAFAEAGISFSGSNDSPTTAEMEAAMEDAFGVGGQVVKCRENNLYEVMMCLDWETLEAFACDESFWNTCGAASDRVTFPEGSGDEAATCSATTTVSSSGSSDASYPSTETDGGSSLAVTGAGVAVALLLLF